MTPPLGSLSKERRKAGTEQKNTRTWAQALWLETNAIFIDMFYFPQF